MPVSSEQRKFATIYFGTSSTNAPLTLPEIMGGTELSYIIGDPIEIPFNNPNYLYNWVALPDEASIPDSYQNLSEEIDEGSIGRYTDLFNASYNVEHYNVIMGNFLVPLTNIYFLYNV